MKVSQLLPSGNFPAITSWVALWHPPTCNSLLPLTSPPATIGMRDATTGMQDATIGMQDATIQWESWVVATIICFLWLLHRITRQSAFALWSQVLFYLETAIPLHSKHEFSYYSRNYRKQLTNRNKGTIKDVVNSLKCVLLVFSLLPDCFHDPVTMICLPCPVVKVSSGIIAMLPLHRRSRCSSRHFHVSSQKHADDRWRIHYIEEPERFVVFSKNNPSQQANFTGVAAACHDTISGQIYWLQKVTAIFFS